MNEQRTANLTGRQHCDWCDQGLALAAIRPTPIGDGAPEYGPCPWCELGARLEFPTGKPGPKGERGARPSWGLDGYWQGRPPVVERAPDHSQRLLPAAENLARMRLLMRRYAGEKVDPLVGLEFGEPARRMEALAAEATRA